MPAWVEPVQEAPRQLVVRVATVVLDCIKLRGKGDCLFQILGATRVPFAPSTLH
jgi:hypothetical protein